MIWFALVCHIDWQVFISVCFIEGYKFVTEAFKLLVSWLNMKTTEDKKK